MMPDLGFLLVAITRIAIESGWVKHVSDTTFGQFLGSDDAVGREDVPLVLGDEPEEVGGDPSAGGSGRPADAPGASTKADADKALKQARKECKTTMHLSFKILSNATNIRLM